MSNKYVIPSLSVLFLTIFLIVPGVVLSADETSAVSDATVAVPQVSGSDSTGAVANPIPDSVPPTVVVPPVSGSDNTGAVANPIPESVPPTAGGEQNGAVSVTPEVVPVNTPAPVGGLGGGSLYAGSAPISTSSALEALPISCMLLSDTPMEKGWDNDPNQVTRLQVFLKKAEKLDVTINGIFDQQTEDAVKAFQTKYMDVVMAPWGATRASGIVYITTAKKINQIACRNPLFLLPSELAIINDYQARIASAATGTNLASGSSTSPDQASNSEMASSSDELGNNGENVSNTAAAGNPSILKRFWKFVVNMFI